MEPYCQLIKFFSFVIIVLNLIFLTENYDEKLTVFEDNVAKQNALMWKTSLDMSYNYIKTFPDILDNSKYLKKLNLSHNSLREFQQNNPINILTSLNLSSNHIKTIQQNFENLATKFPKLENLDLSKNSIKQIDPNWFSKFTSLKKLKLKENQIFNLPEDLLKNLSKLEDLNLSENKIYFKSLEDVSKKHEENSKVFFSSNKLKKLKLRENWICFLPIYLFNNLNNLTHLRIKMDNFNQTYFGLFN